MYYFYYDYHYYDKSIIIMSWDEKMKSSMTTIQEAGCEAKDHYHVVSQRVLVCETSNNNELRSQFSVSDQTLDSDGVEAALFSNNLAETERLHYDANDNICTEAAADCL